MFVLLQNRAQSGVTDPGHIISSDTPMLPQNLLHDVSMHIRESKSASLETIGEFLVIDPQLMQERRLKIVNMDRILDDIHSKIV